MGCGESFEGVAVGADMYHVQKVKAFIGPYCNAGIYSIPLSSNFVALPAFNSLAIRKRTETLDLRD